MRSWQTAASPPASNTDQEKECDELVYKLPERIIAAKTVYARYDLYVYPASKHRPGAPITTDDLDAFLVDIINEDTRTRTYLMQGDWAVIDRHIEEGRSPMGPHIQYFNVTLVFIRHQYAGSSRAGLDRLLALIEGALWGRFSIKLGSDGIPVLSDGRAMA